MPKGKRQHSRKRCLSCKKLKIKCDGADHTCEYCLHTGRDCVYPNAISDLNLSTHVSSELYENLVEVSSILLWDHDFRADVSNWTDQAGISISSKDFATACFHKDRSRSYVGKLADAYEKPAYGDDNYSDDQFFESGFASRVESPRSFSSMGAQMNMTRFELRLLRFFHDQCIPYVTNEGNKKAIHVWRTVFPTYFASSNLVRQATYAMSCLYLWPSTKLKALLEMDNRGCQLQISQSATTDENASFLHIFDKLSIFDNSNESIFSVTTAYFVSTLRVSQELTSKSSGNQNVLAYEDLATIYFSGFLIYSYASLHPHCVLPLVDFQNKMPTDFIGFFLSMRKVFLLVSPEIKERIVDTLIDYTFLTPTVDSEKIGFAEVLKSQLEQSYFYHITFWEIDSKICEENACLERCVFLLESCYLSAIRESHPTPLFKFLVLLEEDFIVLARLQNYFALRVLFVFCCIAIYCQFYLSFHENIWIQYVRDFVENFRPLIDSDAALYEYVITNRMTTDPKNFIHDMRKLNILSFHFGGLDTAGD